MSDVEQVLEHNLNRAMDKADKLRAIADAWNNFVNVYVELKDEMPNKVTDEIDVLVEKIGARLKKFLLNPF